MKLSEKKLREILKLFKESDNKDFKDAIVNVVFILSKNRNDVLVDNEGLMNSLKKGLSLADMFGKLCEELFVKYPMLMSDSDFRKREKAIYKEIERYEAILDIAGVA